MSMDHKVSLLPCVCFMCNDYYTLLLAIDLLSVSKQYCQPIFGAYAYLFLICIYSSIDIEESIYKLTKLARVREPEGNF